MSINFPKVYSNPEKQLKIKSEFFLNRVNISANQMIIGTAKVSTTDKYGLAPLQVRERALMDIVLIWLLHMKCIVKILIGLKYYVKHLNNKILKYF